MPVFTRAVCQTIKALRSGAEPDENEFIDACRLVYDGVRDVRHAFLLRGDMEAEEEEEEEVTVEKVAVKKEKKELTSIKEAVSKINNEEIKSKLDPNSSVYWTAIWSDPKVSRSREMHFSISGLGEEPSFLCLIGRQHRGRFHRGEGQVGQGGEGRKTKFMVKGHLISRWQSGKTVTTT